jgi:hypothetical protein
MEKDTLKWLRSFLFKAFFINLAIIIFVWLLHLTGLYNFLMNYFFGFSLKETAVFMIYLLGAWKILGAILFLVPAIAIHCQIKSKK